MKFEVDSHLFYKNLAVPLHVSGKMLRKHQKTSFNNMEDSES